MDKTTIQKKKQTRVLDKNWFEVAGLRAIKTVAQTALGMFTLGMAVTEVSWLNVLSVSVVAGLYSLLTTVVTGIHEVELDGDDGQLVIDKSSTRRDLYHLDVKTDLDLVEEQDFIKLKVVKKPNPTKLYSRDEQTL